jgi:hypothetical protein
VSEWRWRNIRRPETKWGTIEVPPWHSFRKNTLPLGKRTYLSLTSLFRTNSHYAGDFYRAMSYSAFSDNTLRLNFALNTYPYVNTAVLAPL